MTNKEFQKWIKVEWVKNMTAGEFASLLRMFKNIGENYETK